MALMDFLKGKKKNTGYTPEKAEGLALARGIVQSRRNYAVQRKNFDRDQRVANQSPIQKRFSRFTERIIAKPRRQLQSGKSTFAQRMQTRTIRRAASVAYPAAFRRVQETSAGDGTGKRGRPVGTTKYPGGVYAWRKAQRAQRNLIRQQQVVQQYQQEHMPQQVQQYPQQYPQQQVQQYQPQPGEYPYTSQVSNISQEKPVFKSSGGKPYPVVNRAPLAPATAQPGYVETVDLMTGRRSWKPLPRAESWIRPKEEQ